MESGLDYSLWVERVPSVAGLYGKGGRDTLPLGLLAEPGEQRLLALAEVRVSGLTFN